MLKKDLLSNVDEFEIIHSIRQMDDIQDRQGSVGGARGYDLVYGPAVEEVLQSHDHCVFDFCGTTTPSRVSVLGSAHSLVPIAR